MKTAYLLGLVASLALASNSVSAQGYQTAFKAYDEGLFTPFEDLHALSSSKFTTLSHPAFPLHNVRVKESNFCDGNVRCVVGNSLFAS